jgi:alpha-L-rhamnosidase
MERYLRACANTSCNHLLRFGLGDWCCPDRDKMTPSIVTSTGNYYGMLKRMAFFAELLDKNADQCCYSQLADAVRTAFVAEFRNDDGSWSDGSPTACATALYFGLSLDPQTDARTLAEQMRSLGHRAQFGILGAKYIPRMLAEYGFAEDGFKILTQPEFPGWGNWVEQGYTTLLESWSGKASLNHIMFGDVSAWFYQYLAGITPDPRNPGFKHFTIKPNLVQGLGLVNATHICPYGTIAVSWRRDGEDVTLQLDVPMQTTATLHLPGRSVETLSGGCHEFSF